MPGVAYRLRLHHLFQRRAFNHLVVLESQRYGFDVCVVELLYVIEVELLQDDVGRIPGLGLILGQRPLVHLFHVVPIQRLNGVGPVEGRGVHQIQPCALRVYGPVALRPHLDRLGHVAGLQVVLDRLHLACIDRQRLAKRLAESGRGGKALSGISRRGPQEHRVHGRVHARALRAQGHARRHTVLSQHQAQQHAQRPDVGRGCLGLGRLSLLGSQIQRQRRIGLHAHQGEGIGHEDSAIHGQNAGRHQVAVHAHLVDQLQRAAHLPEHLAHFPRLERRARAHEIVQGLRALYPVAHQKPAAHVHLNVAHTHQRLVSVSERPIEPKDVGFTVTSNDQIRPQHVGCAGLSQRLIPRAIKRTAGTG